MNARAPVTRKAGPRNQKSESQEIPRMVRLRKGGTKAIPVIPKASEDAKKRYPKIR